LKAFACVHQLQLVDLDFFLTVHDNTARETSIEEEMSDYYKQEVQALIQDIVKASFKQ
jgi:hypothetical protein